MPGRIRFSVSRHARLRMAQRHVTADMIERSLRTPDRSWRDIADPALTHVTKRFHEVGGLSVLRVVYNHTTFPWRVVSVFFDRKATRRR
jgi:hypothetical protein